MISSLQEMKELESSIRSNQDSLLSSLIQENGFSYSNIFHNCGQKPLGLAIYNVLKDLVIISQNCWNLDKEDFYTWIDEAFEEYK